MKKILLFLTLMCSMGVFAQTQRYYCAISGSYEYASSTTKFNFGHNPIFPAWERLKDSPRLVDEKGYEIKNMVDAGNFLSRMGWTLQNTPLPYIWIFYKDAESPEKAVEGIMTVDEYNEMKNKRHKANAGKE